MLFLLPWTLKIVMCTPFTISSENKQMCYVTKGNQLIFQIDHKILSSFISCKIQVFSFIDIRLYYVRFKKILWLIKKLMKCSATRNIMMIVRFNLQTFIIMTLKNIEDIEITYFSIHNPFLISHENVNAPSFESKLFNKLHNWMIR